MNRTRLPELDQEAVKVQPPPQTCFSNGLPIVAMTNIDKGQVVRELDRDLSKISMFGCCGLECRDDPLDVPRIELKCHILEFRRFREVD